VKLSVVQSSLTEQLRCGGLLAPPRRRLCSQVGSSVNLSFCLSVYSLTQKIMHDVHDIFTKGRSRPSLQVISCWIDLPCDFEVKVAQRGHFGIESTVEHLTSSNSNMVQDRAILTMADQVVYDLSNGAIFCRASLINPVSSGEIVLDLMRVSKPKSNILNICYDVFLRHCHDF